MSWRNTPLTGFDIESSGLDIEQVSIVTACVGIVQPGGPWKARNWLLKQDQPIPDAATAVHHITTEQANAEGMDHATALAEIREAIYYGWANGGVLCGYNLGSYDLNLLDRELRRYDLGGFEVRGPVIDGLVVDKTIDTYRKGSRKLIDVCRHYGITLDEADAHGAEADALAATRLAWKLAPQLPDDPTNLMQWQASSYALQRTSFAAYLRKQGKGAEADDVAADTSWPLRPAPVQVQRAAAA